MNHRFASTLAGLVWLIAGCGVSGPGADPGNGDPATAEIRAEDGPLRIGDRTTLEITVESPPEHRPGTWVGPTRPGLEIVGIETLPVEKGTRRWRHRSRVALLARETGSFTWPPLEIPIAAPDGRESTLTTPAMTIRVHSILPAFAGRAEPFGPRGAPPRTGTADRSDALATSVWAAVAIAAGAIGLWARRRRKPAAAPGAVDPPWAVAQRELALAASTAPARAAAHAIADVIKRYMTRRFGLRTKTLTTEELARLTPPFAATSRWPGFLALMRELDELRFDSRTTADAEILGLRERALAFVESSKPPEGLR